MLESFRVFFRKRKQFFDVYLHDTTPETFNRRGGGRWGYYLSRWEVSNEGFFGEIHLVKSRVRVDVLSHELDHLRMDYIFSNSIVLSTRNEEWFCRFGDELTRNFWREYEKYKKRTDTKSNHRTKKGS